MTRALVTGATGFIGSNVVRALLDEGVTVRALIRTSSDTRNLDGLTLEQAEGDLRDAASIARVMVGVDVLFHVAARYELASRDAEELMAVNMEGTRTVMLAALRARVSRVVHTSSVAAVGHVREDGTPADESDWADPRRFAGPYEASKYHSERIVHELITREGLPAVIVNPTVPIGPWDRKPTATGQLIVDAASGAFPAYPRGAGLNVVHVRDVARGHVLAWQQGRVGERYILGHREGNLSVREVMDRAAQLNGRRAPRLPAPYALTLLYALADEHLLSWVLGRPPRAPVAGVRLSHHRMWFNVSKAIQELGLPQSPLEEAFADAVAWFRSIDLVHT